MSIYLQYFIETLEALNQLIELNNSTISVKKIRKLNNIPSENRSKINFYWRNLAKLEQLGIIRELDNSNNNKIFTLPVEKVQISKILEKVR